MRRLTFLLALALLIAACSGDEPLEGIDLPPAAVPDEIQPETWAVTFTHDFEPGSWSEGTHFYSLALACDPILDEPTRTDRLVFDVVSPSQIFEIPIYLRVVGLSHYLTGPQTLFQIDPQQPTIAAFTVIGASEDGAFEASETCAGAIFFDEEEPLPLIPQPPFRP